MLSNQSLLFFPKKNKNIYKKYKKKPNIRDFLNLIKKGILPRPHYALGMLLAAKQAKDLGYKSIKVLELGCWNFEGIIDLEHYANDIQEFLKINIEIFGFTLKEGLPKYKPNKYDRLHTWSPSDCAVTNKKNYEKLNHAKIYFGDVKKTIPKMKIEYKKSLSTSPIGFIIYDLDYYTSTLKGLNLLKMNHNFFLPRTYLYFDDLFLSSEYEGERKAITEFNKKNKYKISDIGELAEQLSINWPKWIYLGKRLKVVNFFDHKNHNTKIDRILEDTIRHNYFIKENKKKL